MDRISPNTRSQLDERLTVHDIELLRELWIQFAGHSFERKGLAAMTADRRSGAEQLISLHRLQRYGWITAKDSGWGEVTYAVALPKYGVIQEAFFRPSTACLVDHAAEVITEARPGILLYDLMITAAYLVQEGLPLTSKGRLHKKSVSRLSSQLLLREVETTNYTSHNTMLEGYPSTTALVIDLLQELGLVRTSRHALNLDEQAWMTWLMNGVHRQEVLIFQVLRKRIPLNKEENRERPYQQHVRELICHGAFQPGVWFRVNQLVEEAVQQRLIPSEAKDKLGQELSETLHTWAKLGFGTTGLTLEGELIYCWAIQTSSVSVRELKIQDKQVNQEEAFYVQADYEVLVPPGVSMLTRWRLLLFCELTVFDQLTVLRIEQASIFRALKGCLSLGEIVDFLREHSCTGLPHHIAITLEQWSAAWQQQGRLSDVLPMEQCPTAWFVDGVMNADKETEDQEELQPSWGVPYASGMQLELDTSHSEPVLPKPDELFPGIQSIPTMWHEQFRSYHSSTAWQMIEQAYQWQTKLLIRLEDSTLEYIPRRLLPDKQQVEGTLLLSAEDARWATLSPQDWKEMKLVIAPLN